MIRCADGKPDSTKLREKRTIDPLQKPGGKPRRPGEYGETGGRGGKVPKPRRVTIEPGDDRLPPTPKARSALEAALDELSRLTGGRPPNQRSDRT